MKNMRKFVKQNIKGFIVGFIVTGVGIVTASTIMPSNSVTYNNSSQNVTNVKEALDILLEKVDNEAPNITFLESGKDLYTDYNFSSGMNGLQVYNNLSNGTVTLSRVSMTTPEGSYAVKVTTTGEAYPNLGGFYQAIDSRPNGIYIHRIIAKVPVGYYLIIHHNPVGNGGGATWLTPHEGTGEWQEYAYVLRAGEEGTFSMAGHIAIEARDGYSNKVTWHVASARVIDATTSGETLFAYIEDKSNLAGYGCNQSQTTRPTYTSVSGIGHSAICKLSVTGDQYLWTKDNLGNEKSHLIGSGYSGTLVFTDPTFTTGTNSANVYNNLGNGTVSITRESMKTPVGSYGLTIKTNGTASPEAGGFMQIVTSKANQTYIHRIIAKIPVGYHLISTRNSIGNNSSATWLTSDKGTGKWEEYIVVIKSGSTGSFSTFGHLYLFAKEGYSNTSVKWQVGYASIINATNAGSNYTFVKK